MFGLTTVKKAAQQAALAYQRGVSDGTAKTENLIATIEADAKEAAYKGAEAGLKHAIQQVTALDFEAVVAIWKDKS